MVMLNGNQVFKYLKNAKEENIQPNSVDVRLDDTLLLPKHKIFDINDNIKYKKVKFDKCLLLPNNYELTNTFRREIKLKYNIDKIYKGLVLGTTMEEISLPDNRVGVIEGVSSNGRLGLIIHSTAGFIDSGFKGKITLELSTTHPVILYSYMRIGQITIYECNQTFKYNGKYNNQNDVVGSRINLENQISDELIEKIYNLRFKEGIIDEKYICDKLNINYGIYEKVINNIKMIDYLKNK